MDTTPRWRRRPTRPILVAFVVASALCLRSVAKDHHLRVDKVGFAETATKTVSLILGSAAPQEPDLPDPPETQVVELTSGGSGRVSFSRGVVTVGAAGATSSFVGADSSAAKNGTIIEARTYDEMQPGVGYILNTTPITIEDIELGIAWPAAVRTDRDDLSIVSWLITTFTAYLAPNDNQVSGNLTIKVGEQTVQGADNTPYTGDQTVTLPLVDTNGDPLKYGAFVAEWDVLGMTHPARDVAIPELYAGRVDLDGNDPTAVLDHDEVRAASSCAWNVPGRGVLLGNGQTLLDIQAPKVGGGTLTLTWPATGNRRLRIDGDIDGELTWDVREVENWPITVSVEMVYSADPGAEEPVWIQQDMSAGTIISVPLSHSYPDIGGDYVDLVTVKTEVEADAYLWWNTAGADGEVDISVRLRSGVAGASGPFTLSVGGQVLANDSSKSPGMQTYTWNGKNGANPAAPVDGGQYQVVGTWTVNGEPFPDTDEPINVYRADLLFNSLPDEDLVPAADPDEEDPGGFILLNDNDNDGVSGADLTRTIALPAGRTDGDLKKLAIAVPQIPPRPACGLLEPVPLIPFTGIAKFVVPSGLRAWSSRFKTSLVVPLTATEIQWDLSVPNERQAFSSFVAKGVWLEGVTLGAGYEVKILFDNIVRDKVKITILSVDLDGDYNRDGNLADHANEADAVTFDGPKGFVVLANNDDDNSNDLPDAVEDDAVNGTDDLADIGEFKVSRLGIPAADIPSSFTAEFKVVDPTSGALSDAVRIFPERTATASGGAQFTLPNALVKTLLGGTGECTMGIEGIAYGKQGVVRMTLKDGANEIGSDEFRVMTAPYFVSPNSHNADEVFVSFTSVADVLNAFTAGLSGISPLRKSSDYPTSTGSPTMRYIQDHVEFGYTRTAVGQTTFKSMQVLLGKSPTSPDLLDLIENDRAFYAELEDRNFGDLLVTPETTSRPYGTVVCGSTFSYKDFLKRQEVQPVGGGIVELDNAWLATPHVDNLVAFIPVSGGYKVLVADLQLAIDLLDANPSEPVQFFTDPRPAYNDPANSATIAAIKAKLNAMYGTLETGLGIPKAQFIHVPVAFDPTATMGNIKPFLPVLVNMQYVKSSGGERTFVPKSYFDPFYTDATDGLKAKLNGIGIADSEIKIVPTGSGGGSSPFNSGNGGDAHCISNPSMEAPVSP